MTEIHFRQLEETLRKTGRVRIPAVWLIHGEPPLVERSVNLLVNDLLGDNARELSVTSMEGAAENVPDLLEEINTLALLGSQKIVVFKDARLFESRMHATERIKQIERACSDELTAKAGKLLGAWCRKLGVDLENLRAGTAPIPAEMKALQAGLGELLWNQLIQHALLDGGSSSAGHIEDLRLGIEKGFPVGHFLVVSVYSKAPKNSKFYQSIARSGAVVDCSVPSGERWADKLAQEAVMRESWEQALLRAGKSAPEGVFRAVFELTGFNLATFAQNTEKMIDYVGARGRIELADVQQVLRRTRSDPVFELTNAVADRNLPQALLYLSSLLNDWHPLQIVAALANQIRKLLIARDFLDSDQGRVFYAGMTYPQFQKQGMPLLTAYDAHLQEVGLAWQEQLPEIGVKEINDLRLSGQSGNAYPIFQTLNKAHKFSKAHLLEALQQVNRADVLIKTAGQNAGLVLTQTVSTICGKSGRN